MADLEPLIRLHKHELDEKRRALGDLYSAMTLLERERRDLQRAFEMEKEAVTHTGDIHFTFAQYVEKVKRQHKELDRREAELEKQIEQAKDSLMDTFSELKKYEMTQAAREKREEEARRVKESQAMDEIGLENFRRKGEE
jgi:flagellar export protein FliJ